MRTRTPHPRAGAHADTGPSSGNGTKSTRRGPRPPSGTEEAEDAFGDRSRTGDACWGDGTVPILGRAMSQGQRPLGTRRAVRGLHTSFKNLRLTLFHSTHQIGSTWIEN